MAPRKATAKPKAAPKATDEDAVASWAYSLATTVAPRYLALDTASRLVDAYPGPNGEPKAEVSEHIEAAMAALPTLLNAFGLDEDQVVVRISGRATAGHAIVDGPDELLTISLAVVDSPPPPQPEVDIDSAPVEVDGGTYSNIE